MFRPMRRSNRQLPDTEARKLLEESKRAAFSVNGDDGYPFTIPINFYYDQEENRIYFHSAKAGHKIDSIKANDKVCFTAWNEGIKEDGDWAYYVSSVVVFGRAILIEDMELTVKKVRQFALKYYPTAQEVDEEIARDIGGVQLVAIEIEHMTAKRIHEK